MKGDAMSARGGRRENAGAKKLPEDKKRIYTSIKIPESERKYLKQVCKDNELKDSYGFAVSELIKFHKEMKERFGS